MSATSKGYAQDFLISKTTQAMIKGVEAEGLVNCSLYNIITTIIKPFKNISQSWHIPYFAQGRMSYHGVHGDLRAQDSLKDIYLVAEYLQRKEEMLKKKYKEFEARKSEISEGRMSESEFKLKRRSMRQQLKCGDISDSVYQQRISAMRLEADALQKRIWKMEDSFFEAYFPMSVFGSMRESVIDILNAKNPLE